MFQGWRPPPPPVGVGFPRPPVGWGGGLGDGRMGARGWDGFGDLVERGLGKTRQCREGGLERVTMIGAGKPTEVYGRP